MKKLNTTVDLNIYDNVHYDMNVYSAIDVRDEFENSRGILSLQEEIDIVHQIINGIAKLGGRLLALPLSVCHVSSWTIKTLKAEGFAVNIEYKNYIRNIFQDTIYISWYNWNTQTKQNCSVIYRPQRGSLERSVEDAIIFDSAEKMKEYIVDHYYKVFKYKMFDIDDIVLNGEKEGHEDERIGWHDVRYVCVKRMGEVVYDHPQCIGMWATQWD